MDLAKFDHALGDYLNAITPTATQQARIADALEHAIATMLVAFPDAEIYAQGSYSTDTMSKPLTAAQNNGKAGEYDVDIVVERTVWQGASDALDEVNAALLVDGVFSQMSIDNTKNSCVRINYAEEATGVAFHVDLVPTSNERGTRYVANREGDTWKHSDAKEFADQFNRKTEEHPGIRSVAIILKRLRDLAGQFDNIKSILILTLVNYEDTYTPNGSVMGDLLAELTNIASVLNTAYPPYIANPVNPSENLSDGIKDYASARSFFIDLCNELTTALTDQDYEKLSDIFGYGFSYTEAVNASAAAVTAAIAVPTRAYGGGGDERGHQ